MQQVQYQMLKEMIAKIVSLIHQAIQKILLDLAQPQGHLNLFSKA